MSDDNNQKSRGPRKGGGAGGRDGGNRGGGSGGRPPARGGAGGKAPFRPRSGDDRPRRAPAEGAERRIDGERPAKSFGAKSFGAKSFGAKSFGDKSFGDKPAGTKSFDAKRFEKKPFRERPSVDRAPREGGEQAERPFRERGGDERRSSRPPMREGDRPARSEGAARPFRERGSDEARSRPPRDGDRPARAERPAFRRDNAPRPSRDGERPRGDRPFGDKPRGERSGGERPAGRGFGGPRAEGKRFDAPRGDKPFRPRAERRPHDEPPAETGKLLTSLASQEPERIAKVMARAGVASRRDSEAIIAEGRVSVNGRIIDSPALDIGPDDRVLIDGEPLPERERTRMWLYHKPRGLVTTNHDPEGRPTVFEYLPEDLPRVLSIGRLDINTEGLLLLTNDGGLARMLELPETGWLRRYRVRAYGHVTQEKLDTLQDGVTIDGVAYGPVIARFEREQGANTWLVVDLREGKNREVKTVLEHLGLAVNRLIRVSFGPFQLGDLDEGEVDEIRSKVLKDQLGAELMAKAGVDFEAPRRDELRQDAPAAPPRPRPPAPAPAGDDRPRRRSREEESTVQRTPSLDDRSEKPWKRTVWRDAEAEPQRERRSPPRRGADPKEERLARAAAGDVKRVREAPIADPKGRRVKVERISAPVRDERPREDTPRARAPRKLPEEYGRDRGGERPWQQGGETSEKPMRGPRPPRGDDAGRPARSFGGKPAGERPSGGRSFGDKPSGGRPSGAGRPFGGKPSGGKPSGGRPSGDRPGGGGKGPRPGGGRDRRG